MTLLSRSAVLARCRVSRLPRRPDVFASPSLRFGVLAQVLSRAEGMVCVCRGVGRAAGERRSNTDPGTDRGRLKRRNSFERESENSQKAKVHFPLSLIPLSTRHSDLNSGPCLVDTKAGNRLSSARPFLLSVLKASLQIRPFLVFETRKKGALPRAP